MGPAFQSRGKGPEEMDISRLLDLFRRRWYFVFITFVLALIGSKLYLRYAQPVYEAYTSLKIEDPNAALKSYGFIREIESVSDNIQSEIEIIQSRRMVVEALNRMNFINVSYFTVGRLKTTEVYKNTPFIVILDTAQGFPFGIEFVLTFIDENDFDLSYRVAENEPLIRGEYKLGEFVKGNGFRFQIARWTLGLQPEFDKSYLFKFTTPEQVSARVQGGLLVEQMGFSGSIIKISLKDNVPWFAADFVNMLAEVYVEYDIQNKRQAADQALEFIDGQLDSIKNSVETSSKAIENFKQDREIVTVEEKISKETDKLTRLEAERTQVDILKLSLDRVVKDLTNLPDRVAISVALGENTDPLLQSMINSYNEFVLQKNSLMESFESGHPKIIQLANKIGELKSSIVKNIEAERANIEAREMYYNEMIAISQKRLNTIPEIEHTFGTLLREFAVKDNVLSTLLEKQADAAINRASIVPSVRVIDAAKPPNWPIKPISRKIMILGGGIGISIGIIILVITGLLKTTIGFKEELESLSPIPVIGTIKRSSLNLKHKYPQVQVMDNPKSSLAESIRAIRTNLQFINSDNKSRVISITSSVSGEGKSFITINLAGIISLLNKKVVILDMDLRKPKLHYSFGRDNSTGLSTYLSGTHQLKDIILKTDFENIDIITSGPIPPNPAELIQSSKTQELVDELRTHYDFIVIDTPPVGLVTDGISLMKLSDVSLYILRADYSKKSYAAIPGRIVQDQKVKNLYLVLNSVSQTGGKYTGYGYKIYSTGYYDEEESPTPKWKFWASWFKSNS